MQSDSEEFKKYENIIYCLAHKYAKHYNADFDDMVEVGYEYYVWCLNNFNDKKKMKFSTYLYMQINARMKDELDRIKNKFGVFYEDFKMEDESIKFEDLLKAKDELDKEYTSNLLTEAKKELSYESYLILDWLLSFSWLKNGHITPTELYCQRETGLSQVSVNSGFQEIKYWWRNRGWKISEVA